MSLGHRSAFFPLQSFPSATAAKREKDASRRIGETLILFSQINLNFSYYKTGTSLLMSLFRNSFSTIDLWIVLCLSLYSSNNVCIISFHLLLKACNRASCDIYKMYKVKHPHKVDSVYKILQLSLLMLCSKSRHEKSNY